LTTSNPVRVLVVDDSALICKLLGDILRTSLEIEVIGLAMDGASAVELARKLKPDVVTLDVEMAGMSGLATLPALLEAHESRVVMVSSFTQEGASVTLQALELGAVDFLAKPSRHQISELRALGDVLVSKVLAAAQSRVRRPRSSIAAAPQGLPTTSPALPNLATDLVAIGISLGGPQALAQAFDGMGPPVPPIVVVQHMPANFTRVFADRLASRCSLIVKEAEDGDAIVSNQILIAPGGRHMTVVGPAPRARVAISDGPLVSGHKPSVDLLFRSAARSYGSAAVGIIMTGMGRDGVIGCHEILAAGGSTFGQDEATSVVYGMNKAAFLEGAVGRQFALEELPGILARLARKGG
jgi:two-component system, chemotaxis family, protein-glutamate methylesterase/glutaminase